jgi:hypothetical protein
MPPRKLLKACIISFLATVVLAVTVVLPAEYGIDVLGTGRALGLTAIDQPVLEDVSMDIENPGQPVADGPITHLGTLYRVESREIILQPYDYIEYKYHLVQGASMLFAWSVESPVNQDFHGDPENYPEEPTESFNTSTRSRDSGSFVAPFPGVHGWFWENPGPTPIRIQLYSAGFYDFSVEIRSNRERIRHELAPISDQMPAEEETP